MPDVKPLTTHEDTVRSEWIDYNGHMNVVYYVLAFDHAADRFFHSLDLGVDYVERKDKSIFQLECHLNYLEEVKEGDPLEFTVQLLDYDIKRIHFFTSMYHREDGYLSATAEWLGVHVDLKLRRSEKMPTASLECLRNLHATHARLMKPLHASRSIGIRR